jgi:predicted Zn-dependent protease
MPPIARQTPTGQTAPLARQTPTGQTAPLARPAPTGQTTQSIGRVEKFDDAAAFREAAAYLEQKNWSAALQLLTTLVEKVPYNKSYRAWFHYARGRDAFLGGRADEAISEMRSALQNDPSHAHARHALAELQKRR